MSQNQPNEANEAKRDTNKPECGNMGPTLISPRWRLRYFISHFYSFPPFIVKGEEGEGETQLFFAFYSISSTSSFSSFPAPSFGPAGKNEPK